MAISRLSAQDAVANSTTATVSATYAGATTAGNLLIAAAFGNNTLNGTTISSPGWTTAIKGAGWLGGFIVAYKIALGTETTITAANTSSNVMAIDIFEYTGNANPDIVNGLGGFTFSGVNVTSATTNKIAITYPNGLIFSTLFSTSGGSSFSWVTSSLIGANTAGGVQIRCGENITSSITTFSDTISWTTGQAMDIVTCGFQASPGHISSGINNYQFLTVGNGLSTTEKIR